VTPFGPKQRKEMNGFISYHLVTSITILCPEKELVNIVLRGTGELGIQFRCKGYSLTDFLTTQNKIQVNTSGHGGGLLSKVDLILNVMNSLICELN
jgi:hypothetical protein